MEIVPGIHQVDGVNGNSYILVRDGLIVVDTGTPGSGKKILAYIRNQLHREPKEIRTVLITHFHMDHVGGVAALKNAAPGAKVAIGEADAGYVNGALALPGYPGIMGFIMRIVGKIMKPALFTPDLLLKDGDNIDGLTCIAIPGHTPGSIGLLDEVTGTFFSGDILRYDGKMLAEGPEMFTMDLSRQRQSLRTISGLNFDLLLTGHGVPLLHGASEAVREFARARPPAG